MAAAAKPQLVPALKRLVPLFDRVLVQRSEAITKTKGGIVIPEKAQSKVLHGTVVAVGPGSRNQSGEYIPLAVKVGDKVLLPEYGGTRVELEENKEFHLFRESDILAKGKMREMRIKLLSKKLRDFFWEVLNKLQPDTESGFKRLD